MSAYAARILSTNHFSTKSPHVRMRLSDKEAGAQAHAPSIFSALPHQLTSPAPPQPVCGVDTCTHEPR
jgi:hypothetical protein